MNYGYYIFYSWRVQYLYICMYKFAVCICILYVAGYTRRLLQHVIAQLYILPAFLRLIITGCQQCALSESFTKIEIGALRVHLVWLVSSFVQRLYACVLIHAHIKLPHGNKNIYIYHDAHGVYIYARSRRGMGTQFGKPHAEPLGNKICPTKCEKNNYINKIMNI